MTWFGVLRRYLFVLAASNLVWEGAQMPLYGLWETGTTAQIILYGLHCTLGDVLIGGSALVLSLLLFGSAAWPRERYAVVAGWAILFGFAYTVFSEWFNVGVRKSWAYSDFMPLLPGLEIGLSPLAQWLVIPAFAFWWARGSEERLKQSSPRGSPHERSRRAH